MTDIYSYVIRMSLVNSRMSLVCHSYVFVCHSYVTRMSLVCHPYVLVCHPHITRMPSVCHSYVLVCHPYVTRMWFYHEPVWEIAFRTKIKFSRKLKNYFGNFLAKINSLEVCKWKYWNVLNISLKIAGAKGNFSSFLSLCFHSWSSI